MLSFSCSTISFTKGFLISALNPDDNINKPDTINFRKKSLLFKRNNKKKKY